MSVCCLLDYSQSPFEYQGCLNAVPHLAHVTMDLSFPPWPQEALLALSAKAFIESPGPDARRVRKTTKAHIPTLPDSHWKEVPIANFCQWNFHSACFLSLKQQNHGDPGRWQRFHDTSSGVWLNSFLNEKSMCLVSWKMVRKEKFYIWQHGNTELQAYSRNWSPKQGIATWIWLWALFLTHLSFSILIHEMGTYLLQRLLWKMNEQKTCTMYLCVCIYTYTLIYAYISYTCIQAYNDGVGEY